MTLKPFDIVVVPFPYADRLAEKRRPAVVVSTSAVAKHKLVWLVMVTSAINRRWDSDVDISDLKGTGLPAPSRIRPVKIATADVARVVRVIGHLGAADTRTLKARLAALLAH